MKDQLGRRVKTAHADEFKATPEDYERWHVNEATQCEREGAWVAAVFHWEQVLGLDRDDHTVLFAHPGSENVNPSVESRLAYAHLAAGALKAHILTGRSRASFIPPRPPWALAAQLDLTPLYTQALGVNVSPARRENSFKELAGGVQLLGGVAFDVRGLIRLERAREVRIPVGLPCQRLHFLHAASGQPASIREVVGTYRIVDATGERSEVQILNPEGLSPYSSGLFLVNSSLTKSFTSGSLTRTFAWAGTNAEVESRNQTLFLTRTTWELPEIHRGKIVESLELQAGPSGPVPLIFAITVE